MSYRRRRLNPMLPLTVLLAVTSASRSAGAQAYRLGSAVPSRATPSRWLGRAAPDEILPMSVRLQLRNADALETLIAAQNDPSAPEFRRWLSPQAFADRFAPPPAEYQALADWLRRAGFAVQVWPDRLRIDFRGSVAQAERTFQVHINHYRHRGGSFLANAEAPWLPARFAASVAYVRLDTFPLARPHVQVVDATGQLTTAMAPHDMNVAYDIEPLLQQGLDGKGQTIAIVARANFDVGDVTQFLQQYGVAVRPPVEVFPNGDPGVGGANGICAGIRDPRQRQMCIDGEEGEVLLDVQWASAMAPGATVLVDIAGTDIDASMQDIVDHHPEAKIISMSFGACERLDSSDHTLFGPLYAQAAAQGQTVLVAAGDTGADECQDGRARGVSVLASDAHVTAVGGTALDPGFDAGGNAAAYVSESSWNDSSGASGGGASFLVPKPAYQSAPGVPADGSRDLPDVALLASADTAGYVMLLRGQTEIVGGTSAATPSWAGIVALLNQARNVTGSGSFNPALYALGRAQYGTGGAAVFHDITTGNNSFNGVRGYDAGPGYDQVTGLGTPDVAALARALMKPACAGDCNGDGVVTVSEVLVGVDIVVGAAPLAACAAMDADADGRVTVSDLIVATSHVLGGCPAP